MKHFTRKEAEALIPELETLFQSILETLAKVEEKTKAVDELAKQEADPIEITIEKGKLEFLISGINCCLEKLAARGAVPKGLNPVLVDFPYRLGKDEVYLCWRLGERKITHYHGLEEGFGGRKPLPRNAS